MAMKLQAGGPITSLCALMAMSAGAALPAHAQVGGKGAGPVAVAMQGSVVRLAYASFDPLAAQPVIPAGFASEPGAELVLVQFSQSPTDVVRAAIAASGGRVMRFMTDNTHLVRIPAAARHRLHAVPGVRWIGEYHPAYRLDPRTLAAVVAGASERSAVRYSIEAVDRGLLAQSRIAAVIGAMGGLVELVQPDGYRMEATLTRDQLIAVLKLDDVNYIDPSGPMGSDMDLIRPLLGATAIQAATGFTGQGVRGSVVDGWLDVDHIAFQGVPPLIQCENSSLGEAHGTAMYGILFADGSGDPAATGMLPDADHGIFCSYTELATYGGGTSPYLHIEHLLEPPYEAVFQSLAMGSAYTANYSTISAQTDDVLFQFDLLTAQSQGTAGSLLRPQAWAKNIVAVGGIVHQNTLSRADDTGGLAVAATDGRIKPDLVAPQDSLFTAAPGDTFATMSGVSGSTAIVAGAFGLVFQMWHEGVWAGFGGAQSVFDSKPAHSTARALVINSAFQYNWVAGGPTPLITRRVQGWGMPDLEALYAARNSRFIVNETDPLTHGQMRTYLLDVAPGQPALKATMVYLDPAGNPAAAQARVNDLTLRVTAPNQTVYWGNAGITNGIWTAPNGIPDTANVVENVFIPNPAAGEWRIEVIASQIVQDARPQTPEPDADFALVVSGVSMGGACYANCDQSTAVPVLNVADFTCFLQRFAAGEAYANCDQSTIVPVLNVADFTCFLQEFAGGCP